MKKLFLLLFIIVTLKVDAQYVTTFADNIKNNEVDGTYYYIPRSIIRLDFEVEKRQETKGRFSSFAKEMLDTEDFVNENKTSYHIKNINVQTITEADPNYVFFISADEKNKESYNINIEMTAEGIIKSLGYKEHNYNNSDNPSIDNEMDYNEDYSEYNYLNIREEDDDDEGKGSKPSMTEKEIAETVIEEIKNLRIAYFDLITGYQEVNYGETINYMTEKIKDLEKEYLSMFLGKINSHTFTKTFYIIPEEGKYSFVLGKFSESDGFSSKAGETVKVNYTNISTSDNINKLGKTQIEDAIYNNKIFYRKPANVSMQIMLGDNIILENRIKISQFGNIMLLPINKMKMIFDTNTGQLISVIKE